jgi:large subunit ribosomal protein L19
MYILKLKDAEDYLMSDLLIKAMEAPENENVPDLRVGDDVTIHLRIIEGTRERIQLVRGTVIRLPGGGNNASVTVRRIAANGIGVERTFLLRSPLIEKIEVHRHAHVRRAKLYYLRDRTGKSARLKEKRLN